MGKGLVREDFERALKAARRDKLIYARHAGTVAAARALADKIDAWDIIVQWALEDEEDHDLRRPMVPQNDNTSIPTFLKYMDQLGLTVAADRAQEKAESIAASRATKSSKVKGAASGVSKLEALQAGVGHKIAK